MITHVVYFICSKMKYIRQDSIETERPCRFIRINMQDIRDQKKPTPRNLTERFTDRLTDINLIIITYFPSQVYFKRTFAAKFEICYKYRSQELKPFPFWYFFSFQKQQNTASHIISVLIQHDINTFLDDILHFVAKNK